ncbi:MAG: hypothetical protein NC124_16125 [Clostridium sp.]|nr:hypothetical protein [Clostridium sp.]
MSDGITSQYGFLFQRYAFIENVISSAAMNLFFTYEGVDDIDVSDAKVVDMLVMASASNNRYIQVKSGTVSKDCWSKVIGNWILTDDYQNAIFILLCENELDFNVNDADIIDSVYCYFEEGASKSKKSIARKVNDKIFEDNDENAIKEIIRELSQKCTITNRSFDELKGGLLKTFTDTYCTDVKIYEKAKERRFERFIEYIVAEIDAAIEKKKKYTITFQKLMDIVNRVRAEISDNKYTIETVEIKKRKKKEAEMLMRDRSIREIKQLLLVQNNSAFVMGELVKELLYKDFRDVYADGGIEISNIEDIAHTNYEDALLEFDETPTPKEVFVKTTRKPIESSILDNSSIYRNGCYVFLTGDDIDPDLQISWGDDNE